jgi:hypothetical protein
MEIVRTIMTDIQFVEYTNGRVGEFTAIIRCKGGFPITNRRPREQWPTIKHVFDWFKSNSILAIEFKPDGVDHTYTVYARKGSKIVIMDTALARELTVGDINSCMSNTNLCDQKQYDFVNAKTWASKAFVQNR